MKSRDTGIREIRLPLNRQTVAVSAVFLALLLSIGWILTGDQFSAQITRDLGEVIVILFGPMILVLSLALIFIFLIVIGSNRTPSTLLSKNPNSAQEKVEQIADRFHTIVDQLNHRHRQRQAFSIDDEYDVQDLFHALLKLFFSDIRPEEGTPSNAGGASRMDFLLKSEQMVVEIKMARPGLGAKEIGNQLAADILRYRKHPDCKTLICFVYDPNRLIRNPDGLEGDLSQTVNGLNVIVIVAPKA